MCFARQKTRNESETLLGLCAASKSTLVKGLNGVEDPNNFREDESQMLRNEISFLKHQFD